MMRLHRPMGNVVTVLLLVLPHSQGWVQIRCSPGQPFPVHPGSRPSLRLPQQQRLRGYPSRVQRSISLRSSRGRRGGGGGSARRQGQGGGQPALPQLCPAPLPTHPLPVLSGTRPWGLGLAWGLLPAPAGAPL
ncbi:hypothetical protein V8C86DRAFT_2502393 [Haematococcus lacustris]